MGNLEDYVAKRIILWSHPPGSNRRPADYESAALPAELGWPVLSFNDLTEIPPESWVQLDSIGLLHGPRV